MTSRNIQMLSSTIKKIRDILRAVGVTDSDSISHCIAFVTLRLLTPQMCQTLKIPEEYAFINFKGDLNEEELRNKFWQLGANSDCFITYLRNSIGLKSFKFKEEVKNTQFWQIFALLEKLDSDSLKSTCDIVGDIYELHLKTGAKSSRDLGQFFTNRLVIKYMVDMVKPEVKNGVIETIVDPTMGTGGFLTMAIDYLNKHHKVDWKKNCKRVFGFDLARTVQEYASLNLLLETGVKFPHMITRDTLNGDICIDDTALPESCDIILANEPMGLKSLKFANFCERIKELKMSGTKAEPAFLQLFMQALNLNGRCAVIVPDGVLFSTSKQHSETRKYLIDNFDVRQIVKMNDKNFFMNTGVNASIIYFVNTGEHTEKVQFSTISLNKEGTGLFELLGETVEYDRIVEKDYVLNPSLYDEENKEEVAGVEYKTLGELCSFKRGKQLSVKNFESGIYPVIGGGQQPAGYHSKWNCESNITLISSSGAYAGFVNRYLVQTWMSDCFSIYSSDTNLLDNNFLYYFLKSIQEQLYKLQTGTGQPHIYSKDIATIKIPLPPLSVQQEIVNKLDILSSTNETCTKLIEQLKQKFKIYVDAETKGCLEYKALGEMCDINQGKSLPKTKMVTGTFDVVGGGKIIGKHNEYNRKGKDVIVTRVGDLTVTWMDKPYFLTENGFSLNIKTQDNCIIKWVYYYLTANKTILEAYYSGTAQRVISKTNLSQAKIFIPSISKQEEIIKELDTMSDLIKTLEQQIQTNEQLMKTIVSSSLTTEPEQVPN